MFHQLISTFLLVLLISKKKKDKVNGFFRGFRQGNFSRFPGFSRPGNWPNFPFPDGKLKPREMCNSSAMVNNFVQCKSLNFIYFAKLTFHEMSNNEDSHKNFDVNMFASAHPKLSFASIEIFSAILIKKSYFLPKIH